MRQLLSFYSENMTLSDSDREIIWTKIRKFPIDKALTHMQSKGYKMSSATYWRERGKLSTETLSRIYDIAKEMTERHVERIDDLERIKPEMWNSYDLETEPRFKVRILKEIKELQLCISSYC